MSDIARRIQTNVARPPESSTWSDDIGFEMMRWPALVGGTWMGASLLPFIGVPVLVPILTILFIVFGFYLRFIK